MITSTDAKTIAQELAQRLEDAWNAGDGTPFAAAFSADADFVAVRGDLRHGRDEIAAGHQQILDTIYRGSTVRYEVLQARPLADGVIVAHVGATLIAPSGPLAGENHATITLVLVERDGEHEIAAFHNTLVMG